MCVPIIKVGESEFFFTVNKDRSDLLNELNFALSKIQDENKQYNLQIYDKYVSPIGTNAFLAADEIEWLSRHGTIRVGYKVLRSIGERLRRLARELGGVGCRQGEDTFLVYCPHQYA